MIINYFTNYSFIFVESNDKKYMEGLCVLCIVLCIMCMSLT